jgi:hypothetical protein
VESRPTNTVTQDKEIKLPCLLAMAVTIGVFHPTLMGLFPLEYGFMVLVVAAEIAAAVVLDMAVVPVV